jgi:hypothetical protein
MRAQPADEEPAAVAGAIRSVPARIAFQGFLTDLAGVPLTGSVSLDLALYNAATGGAAVWSEQQAGVPVTDGVFRVSLGSVTVLDPADFDGTPLWLGIRVNGGTEMARTELLSSPFALRSLEADHALTADTAANVPSVLDDLSDVSAPAPASGQVLQYNGTSWAPATVSSGFDSDWTVSGTDLYPGPGITEIGIGTTSPFHLLHVVAGTSNQPFYVKSDYSGGAPKYGIVADVDSAGTGLLRTGVASTVSNASATTTPSYGFDAAVTQRSNTGTVYGYRANMTPGSGAGPRYGFYASGEDRNYFSGSVGIGTATPSVELDVVGDADISGQLLVSGGLTAGLQVSTMILSATSANVTSSVNANSANVTNAVTANTFTGASDFTSTGGDFYAGLSNGVINCGGGVMSATANIIADSTPTPSIATGDEDLYIGGDLEVIGNGFKTGGGSWATISDIRLKGDVRPFDDGLASVLQIRPIRFRYAEGSGIEDDREFVGVSAQDMLAVAPYMVEERALRQVIVEDESGVERVVAPGEKYFTFDPSALDYLLVNAVKEQQAVIERQQAVIDELQRDVELLRSR